MMLSHQFKSFLIKYQTFESSWWDNRLENHKTQTNQLFERFNSLNNELDRLRKDELPFYNIFQILNVRTYEEKLHTPFLRELLDIEGKHETGAKFLASFLEILWGKQILVDEIAESSIEEEKATPYGRIDLLIQINYQKRDYVIVIENKIYAADQDKQLARYYAYLRDSNRWSEDQISIVYLTPNTKSPSGDSIEPRLRKKLLEKDVLKLLGYHENIIPWLERNYQSLDSIHLKFMIRQYIQTIEQL